MTTKIKAGDMDLSSPIVGEALVYQGQGIAITTKILPIINGLNGIKKSVTLGMTGTTLLVTDTSCTTTSIINWTSQTAPVGFIEIIPSAGSFTINSTSSETGLVFNYILFF